MGLADVAASDESRWAMRAALGSRWTRGRFDLFFWGVCLNRDRCETLKRFGNCGVCWSLSWSGCYIISLARWGRVEECRDYGCLYCRRFERGAASASGRVVLGNCSAVFGEDLSVARKESATFGVLSLAPGYVGGVRQRESGLEREGSLWNVPSEGARRYTLGRSTLVLGRRVGERNGSSRSGSRVGNARGLAYLWLQEAVRRRFFRKRPSMRTLRRPSLLPE